MNAITEPEHYSGPIECIDAIRAALGDASFIDYCRANALKYLWRAGRKGDALEDFQKASVYLRFAENAYLGDQTKACIILDAEPDAGSAADCDECRAQADALMASLEDRLEAQQAATRKTVAALQAKIDRQRSQLRSRLAYQTLIPDIQAWQRETFPDAKPHDYLMKLIEEMNELFSAASKSEDIAPELADVSICLVGLAQAFSIPLIPAILDKFKTNQLRTWGKDCKGQYRHIEG